jgi:hypothetical protein
MQVVNSDELLATSGRRRDHDEIQEDKVSTAV